MGDLLLYTAIIFEVIGTTSMKYSHGFSKLIPTIITTVTYLVCFTLFSTALKYGLEVGKAYAIWSGLGTVLITIAGIVIFKESINLAKISGISLIVSGVVILNLFGLKN